MKINVIAILLSFAISIFKRFSSKLSTFIVSKIVISENELIVDSKNELKKLYKERNSYNQVDEFAKYTLVDRQINKILDKMQENKNNVRKNKMAKIMYFNVAFTILTLVMSLFLIWSNRDSPIIDFSDLIKYDQSDDSSQESEVALFYPLDSILSFPCTSKKNSIGVTVWIFITSRLVDFVIAKCQRTTVVASD